MRTLILSLLITLAVVGGGCKHKDGDDTWKKLYGNWRSVEVKLNDTVNPDYADQYALDLNKNWQYTHQFPGQTSMFTDTGSWSVDNDVTYLYFVSADTSKGRYNFVILKSDEGVLWIRRQINVLSSLEVHFVKPQ